MSAAKWSIGGMTGTLFKNGNPTAVDFKVYAGPHSSAHYELVRDANACGELLSALKDVMSEADFGDRELEARCLAVIAKAEGRT